MSTFFKRSLIAIISLLTIINLQAQPISVSNAVGMSPDTLIKNYLAAEGVKLLNGKWNWSTGNITGQQIGRFTNTNTNFPFSAGIIMTTGNVSVACGPNSTGSASSTTGVTSATADSDLSALVTYSTTTTNVLEFDFQATSDTFAFTYIFASEEYPEYSHSQFNDVFAFFLRGMNPYTGTINTRNVAIIPNTVTAQNPNGLPVTINNLNQDTHQNYYVTNNNNAIEFDGYTVPLTATSYLLACNEYHMKMSIANVSDPAYDSGVFLKKGSFYLPVLDISDFTDMEDNDTIIKNCNTKTIDLSYSEPARQYLNISVGVAGSSTAEWGNDFVINQINPNGTTTPVTSDNNEITFNQGDTLIRLNIASVPTSTFAQGQVKTIKLVFTQFLCDNFIHLDGTSEPLIQRDTLTYYMVDNNLIIMNDTTVRYCNECTHVKANLISGTEPLTYHWTPTTGITNPNARESDAQISNNTVFTVTATDRWGCLSDTATYAVDITKIPTIEGHYTISPKSGCIPMEVEFNSQVTPDHSDHIWRLSTNGGADTTITERNFHYIYTNPGEYTVSLHTISAPGCEDSIRLNNVISVSAYPTSNFTFEPTEPLNGRDVLFTDASQGADITSYEWSFGDGGSSDEKNTTHAYHVSSNETFTINHIVTNKNGCADTATKHISIEDKFVLYVPNSFTPNEDEINDIFLPITQDIAEYEITIYDRYGGVVFTTKDTAQGWDGTTMNGKTCQPGIYIYFIRYVKYSNLQETLIKRGSITLVR